MYGGHNSSRMSYTTLTLKLKADLHGLMILDIIEDFSFCIDPVNLLWLVHHCNAPRRHHSFVFVICIITNSSLVPSTELLRKAILSLTRFRANEDEII